MCKSRGSDRAGWALLNPPEREGHGAAMECEDSGRAAPLRAQG